MKQYYFCTYFDSNYLSYGLSLIRSLEKNCEVRFTIYVLCLDQKIYSTLKGLNISSVELIKLSHIEDWDASLLKAKSNRSLIEYYFTLSPILPLYVLETFKVNIIASLDADIMFFSSPSKIYEELGLRSIYIVEHRFRRSFKDHDISGRFNVQCQLFRNNEIGIDCLNRWRVQCIDWCYDRHEDGKFADQKYLDEWPKMYGNEVVISKNLGVGLAAWNVDGEEIIRSKDGFLINGEPLIFFHFHGLKIYNHFIAKSGFSAYKTPVTNVLRDLYISYISDLFLNGFESKNKKIRKDSYSYIRSLLSGIKHKDLIVKLSKF